MGGRSRHGAAWPGTAGRAVTLAGVNRSLWAVLIGTFTLRFSTGLTGLLLSFYLKHLQEHHGIIDQVLGLGAGVAVGAVTFSVIHALFYVSELGLSPLFGVLSDRLSHYRVMQYGPVFGIVAAVMTWATTSVPLIGATRLVEGSATASSIPSILGFISGATAHDEGLRGRAVARFEAATLGGLLAGFVAAGLLWDVFGPASFLVNAGIYAVSLAIYRYGVDRSLDLGPGNGPADRPRFELSRYRKILTGTHVWLLAPTWVAINAVLGLYTTQTIFQVVRGETASPSFPDQLLMGRFDPVQISLGIAIGGLLFFGGLLWWGNRFRRFRRTTIILYGIGGGLLLVAGALLINHSGDESPILRLVYAVPILVGMFALAGATPAAIGLLADVTEGYPDDRGAIMGLYSVFLAVGQITGALIGGFAAQALGLDGILLASVVLLLLAVAPLVALRRHEHYLGGPAEPAVLG
jgi:MFS family permease